MMQPKFALDPQEVMRYVEYSGKTLTKDKDLIIAQAIDTVHHLICTQYVLRYATLKGSELVLEEGDLLLPGKDIAAHLEGAQSCAVMVCTLGERSEEELRRLRGGDVDTSLAFDAACSVAIEALADWVEAQIGEAAQREGKYITWRFGPGYGDFPLTILPRILEITKAEGELGVSLNESFFLVPSKSMAAVVGLFDAPQPTMQQYASPCDICSFTASCGIKARGLTCRNRLGRHH